MSSFFESFRYRKDLCSPSTRQWVILAEYQSPKGLNTINCETLHDLITSTPRGCTLIVNIVIYIFRGTTVKAWHEASRADLAQHPELQPPTSMQDIAKTLEIYGRALYPTLRQWGLESIVEDNASPHNNDTIRASHHDNNVSIVGYTATPEEK